MKKFALFLLSVVLVCCASDRQRASVSKPAEAKSTPAEQIKAGLLVIDAQKYFIPGHPESVYAFFKDTSHHVHTASDVIPAMTTVIDWAHSKGLPTIATYEAKNTDGYALPEELETRLKDARRYVKLFYDATKHDEFMQVVKESDVKNWFVIGAETDVCVYQTTMGLLSKGYQVTLIKDAVYSGRNDTTVAWANLEKAGASVISFEEVDEFRFNTRKPRVSTVPDQTALIVTILQSEVLAESGNRRRLDHLKAWARITSTKVEEYATADEIPNVNAPRVFAGAVDQSALKSIQSNPSNLVVVDAVTSEPPTGEYDRRTFKLFVYQLMASARFYHVGPEALQGWQVPFKQALVAGKVQYLEETQNLK